MLRPTSVASLAIVALLSIALGSTGHAQAAADIPALVRASRDAVVTLRVFGESGEAIASGSGFFLIDGRVATNSHVIEDAARVEIIGADGQLIMVAPYAEVLSTERDLALLPAPRSAPVGLRIADQSPDVGETVVVIGAPEGLTNTVTTGIVSAVRNVGGQALVQISAPISPGSSGGPVLNSAGEVVGVSVASLRDGQNLNFAVPATDLRALAQSPAGQLAFPRSTVAPSRPSPSSAPVSDVADIRIESYQHFELRLNECRRIDEARVRCDWEIANQDRTGQANSNFYVMTSALYAAGTEARTSEAMLGRDLGRVGGFGNMLNQRIPGITTLGFTAIYDGVPSRAAIADILIGVSVGFFGSEDSLWFRDVQIR